MKIELVPILGILICVTTYAHKQLVLARLCQKSNHRG